MPESTLLVALTGLLHSAGLNAALWGLCITFSLCVVLAYTQRWHGAFTSDSTHGIQKFHTAPTPRVGGIPIIIGVIVSWFIASQDIKNILTPLIFAGMPAFLSGVIEDLTKKVGVYERLGATIVSGLLAWWMTGYSLTRVDVWGIDWLLQFTVVSVFFTAFAIGGVANSINIIDGFNGLASSTSVFAFIGYALIAYAEGDQNLAAIALILGSCVGGFFWVNWPFGKIFLGDGGSYFIGFSLAWIAVLLIERNVSVSAFAVLLVCTHPVTEVLFSIFRRKVRKAHPGMPDRLHFHSLVKRRYVARWFSMLDSKLRNSLTGVFVGLLTMVAVLLAVHVYRSMWLSVLCFIGLALGYVAIYARMVRHRWVSPVQFLLAQSNDVSAMK